MSKTVEVNALVIGGGFFGCQVALDLASRSKSVHVIEKSEGLLRRASYSNQARVHGGYHYPRSFLTANRSRANFQRFSSAFKDSVVSSFDKYYAIADKFSQVNARQFWEFCSRMDAPIEVAPERVRKLFNPDLVEEVFRVQEYAFDARKLGDAMSMELELAGIGVRLQSEAALLERRDGKLLTTLRGGDSIISEEVWICTYSAMNHLLHDSKLPVIPLRHELTEMALVEVPDELRNMGITVMDGPFFSCMPFPSLELHTLSHVRYTPHGQWEDAENNVSAYDIQDLPRRTQFEKMRSDAQRFVPALSECKYRDSLWEIKTILPRSDRNDSRPILYRPDHGIPGVNCVLGGKIDNVFDVVSEMRLDREQVQIS